MTSNIAGVLAGGGECGAVLRSIDWEDNPLGPPGDWPVSLRTSVKLILHSDFPMMIHWGDDLITFYNDAYAPSLGSKHPGNLGRPAKEWWSEMWDQLEPIFSQVLAGKPYYVENAAYQPDRFGGRQTAYFTHCHSPMWGDTGEIDGIFLVVKETTGQMVAESALKKANDDLRRQVEKSLDDQDRIWTLSVDLLGVADADGVWLSVNPAWTTALGWEASEIVGRTTEWLEHPEDRRRTSSEIERLAHGKTTFSFENRIRRRDGSYCPLSWRAVPADGLLYCVARDLTSEAEHLSAQTRLAEALGTAQKALSDQQAADEARRAVQQELSHRLKNAMAVVQAIVTQSARSGGPTEDVVKAIRSRIQALSDAQDTLVHGLQDGADIVDVVRTALRPHTESDDRRVSLLGPSTSVSAQQGLGLALVIHELATNAIKYGSLTLPDGRVLVEWMVEDDRIRLEWTETGGPPVTPPKREGFGSRLLTRIVPSYFSGKGTLVYAENGVRYELTGSL